MNRNSEPSANAEEICNALEQAVLKYFPHPVETVDTFLFSNADDTAADDPQSLRGATVAPVLVEVKRALSFTHPF